MGFGAGEIACKLEVITEDSSSASGAVVANCDARSARTQEDKVKVAGESRLTGLETGQEGRVVWGEGRKKEKKKKRTLAETMYL